MANGVREKLFKRMCMEMRNVTYKSVEHGRLVEKRKQEFFKTKNCPKDAKYPAYSDKRLTIGLSREHFSLD